MVFRVWIPSYKHAGCCEKHQVFHYYICILRITYIKCTYLYLHTSVRTQLPPTCIYSATYVPIYLSTYLPTCLHIPTFLPISTYLLIYLPTYTYLQLDDILLYFNHSCRVYGLIVANWLNRITFISTVSVVPTIARWISSYFKKQLDSYRITFPATTS